MIERLATQQDAAAAARRAPETPPSADPAPRAWILSEGDRMAVPPTIAQVAMTDDKTGNRLKTLQGLAGTALVFVNPAVGGIATAFGGLFHSDNQKRTAIWALAGTAATRALRAQPVFEVEFGHIPGVDPDEYQPAIVRLVPTKDNYRLVAAAKTDGSRAGAVPDGPIIEEPVVTKLEQLGRSRYRAAVNGSLPAGEYALVLRPVDRDDNGRRRRRRSEASLGDLFGGVVGHILYFTWDFAVAGDSRGNPRWLRRAVQLVRDRLPRPRQQQGKHEVRHHADRHRQPDRSQHRQAARDREQDEHHERRGGADEHRVQRSALLGGIVGGVLEEQRSAWAGYSPPCRARVDRPRDQRGRNEEGQLDDAVEERGRRGSGRAPAPSRRTSAARPCTARARWLGITRDSSAVTHGKVNAVPSGRSATASASGRYGSSATARHGRTSPSIAATPAGSASGRMNASDAIRSRAARAEARQPRLAVPVHQPGRESARASAREIAPM